MTLDSRRIRSGRTIHTEGYCDQPYVVVNGDGSWTCCMTIGHGREGEVGQHVVSFVSADQGHTWEGPYDIEPAGGPEASWAQPLLHPETGRIYVFYTFNKDNLRGVRTVDGETLPRVDSLGVYAYRYSDDAGRTWSTERYEIPMRRFACDRHNAYGGNVLFFWGVGKPFIHHGAAYVPATKVGGFARRGFFVQNEGVLVRGSNLLTQHDPARHVWETLPEGDAGLRAPPGGGRIAGEFNATPMNDGSLFGTFRTVDGYAGQAYSRDDGWTWEVDWMRYRPGGRKVKNPRAANFVRRFSNGKYLYWFAFHGGEPLARACGANPDLGYGDRNPAWLCGGVERDGRIYWSQPELALYDEDVAVRFSYPDFVEQDGRYFVTETQKKVARMHALDHGLLDAMWRQAEGLDDRVAHRGLLLEAPGDEPLVVMSELPVLGAACAPSGRAAAPHPGGGLTLEFWVRFDEFCAGQVAFDSRDEDGNGIVARLADGGCLQLVLSGRGRAGRPAGSAAGLYRSAWETDPASLEAGRMHHVAFIVDGGPRIVSVMVDGELCDGGPSRQYGWGRLEPGLEDVNGGRQARLAASLRGTLRCLRVYGRYLLTSEAVANYRAGPDAKAAGGVTERAASGAA